MQTETLVDPTIEPDELGPHTGAAARRLAKTWSWTAICQSCVPARLLAQRQRYLDVDRCVDDHLAEPGHGEHEIDVFPEL